MAGNQDQRVQIEVKGEVEVLLPAERAVLAVEVRYESEDKDKTSQAVISSAKEVETVLRSISTRTGDKAPTADYWSRTSLSESSYQNYDSEKRVHLAREYTAKIDYSVSIQNFSRLGPVIHDLTAIAHVSSQGVSWVLTTTTMEAQHSKLRTMAAKNAMVKANDYAEALGFKKVTAVEMREATHYVRSSNRKGGGGLIPADPMDTSARNMMELDWEDVGVEAFQYTPEEVKMSQSVNGKFAAE
ncbi:uncharacterized protein LTR77_007413 [Saxophila tyrrhenica]|uniref:SIMPL domain-containing protein n=1 Tax=Saxophila tyrrhenica TaxID=1690608 RepID=A0AAV9P4H3_9PEZI|nr:hypothetical protein LTR77_007413 [Saxophila tyrrhenica]